MSGSKADDQLVNGVEAAGLRMVRFKPLLDWHVWLLPLLASVFLIVVGQYNYLLFHTLAELFCIVIGMLMYVVALQTYRYSREHFLMYLASGFFWIAVLDLFHMLIYKGMGVFPIATANPATQFWIAARYCEALLLLSAPFFFNRAISPGRYFMFFAAGGIVIYGLIMGGYFPACYITGAGLTPFKVISEYIISALLLSALIHFYLKRHHLNANIFPFLASSIVLTIFAELAFTSYVSVYGLFNMVGHILKVFSFWLIFFSIVRFGLRKPYEDLMQNHQLLDNIVENIPNMIFLKRASDLRYEMFNRAGETLLGIGRDKLLGKNDYDTFPKEDADFFTAKDREAMAQSDVVDIPEESIETTHGSRILHTKKISLRDEEGRPRFLLGISEDITERKQAQDALAHRLDELERFQKATVQRELRFKELRDENERLRSEIAELEGGKEG